MKGDGIDKIDDINEDIITKSNPDNLILDKNEQMEDSHDAYKTFECQLINQGHLDKINIIINLNKKTIEVKLFINNKDIEEKKEKINDEDNFIYLRTIEQIDFVSFLSQEDIKEEKINDIRNKIILNKNIKNIEQNDLLSQKEICSLTYFPLTSKSECNFCKCLFCCNCKCRNKYEIREFNTDYYLIQTDYIIQIKKYIQSISLPKLNELQAKNRKRKILAFINPIGGKGNALTLWDKAEKIFEQTDIEIDKIITTEFKQAYNYVLTLDPMKYDGFIACSGDGIIHEIINAIFHRNEEDKNKFLSRCAICTLPAGSGNGLSKAISDYCGDDNRVETHCYYLCKGKKKKIDVQEMQIKGLEKKVYSVVAFMFGFLAECDLDSECLRCIGMFRTTLMGAVRFFCLRDYFASFYYLPEDASSDLINNMPDINTNIEDETKYGLIKENDRFNMFVGNNIKFASEDLTTHPLAKLDDGFHDIFTIPESKGGTRGPLLRYLIKDMDSGDFFTDEDKKNTKAGYRYYKIKWWRLIPKRLREDPDDVNHDYNWNKCFSIDGERYDVNPIQCRTINQIFDIYSGKE
jgi:sphingosine kinase